MPKRTREKPAPPQEEATTSTASSAPAPEAASASEAAAPPPAAAAAPLRSSKLSAAALTAYNAEERAKGLVYLGFIPSGMRPIKLRHLLSRYGELGRLYLAPEDPAVYKRRLASGGSKALQFVEGWVEFLDKRVGRAAAAAINGTPMEGTGMGSSKRDKFGSALWNIQYLRHFKWHHLTEKVAYERRMRAVKLRGQLAAAKKEADAYLGRVDQSKALEAMAEKRRKREEAGGGAAAAAAAPEVRRVFKQRRVVGAAEEGEGGAGGQ